MASSSSRHYKLRIRNASEVVCVCINGECFRRLSTNNSNKGDGDELRDLHVINNGGVIVDSNGLIAAVGSEVDIEREFPSGECSFDKEIDASGMAVLPGLVDAHTHPVWAGDRTHEFEMKLAGATYLDIHKKGGGIGFTVKHTAEVN